MKYVILDLEADGLTPTKIHCAVTLTNDGEQREWLFSEGDYRDFIRYLRDYPVHIGHNLLGFDLPVLRRLGDGMGGERLQYANALDTLVISQLTDFPREEGHSLESYGAEAGVQKLGLDITDWTNYDPIMLHRCHSDVLITNYLLKKFMPYITSDRWKAALRTEHDIAWYCNDLRNNGFAFDRVGALALREKINEECQRLVSEFRLLFPPRSRLIKEIIPKATKSGTLHRGDFRWAGTDLTPYSVGAAFSHIEFEEFNPGSTKQRIDRLTEAGWEPTEKTKGYKEFLRGLPRTQRGSKPELTAEQAEKLGYFKKYGWTCDEKNLATVPPGDTATGAQKLVRWLLLISRVRRLDEWLENCREDGRIHGRFRGIGAWTHRMSHSSPNMGNIPKYVKPKPGDPETTPYSDLMRALWIADRDRFLVGVDAEGIQLRVLAHYLDDKEFTYAVVSGSKEDGTDPHSVNARAIGSFCKSRDDAKTFIYAWLLGAGLGKVAEILKCTTREAQLANDNFLERYSKLKELKDEQIPRDAFRGWFEGFDGRAVRIPGDDAGVREHLALAGYLQNGEAIVMKRAMQIWYPQLVEKGIPFKVVNFVHDEWQTETIKDMAVARQIAELQADAIRRAGADLNLRCPMAGSIYNSSGALAIGGTWLDTH